MKRLYLINQVLYSLFKVRIVSSVEHYAQNEIVGFYENFKNLSLDEQDVFEYIKNQANPHANILIFGAGCGREVHHFLNLNFNLFAYEPVFEMSSKIDPSVEMLTSLNQLASKKFDFIWITKNLFSIIPRNNFKEVCRVLTEISNSKTRIFFNADVFDLTFKQSKKFYFSKIFLKMFYPDYQKGDVLRRNLDFGVKNNNLIIYHYYSSEEEFVGEVSSLIKNIVIKKINDVFFIGSFD